MNSMSISPDPPLGETEFLVCYKFVNQIPGTVVEVEVQYGTDTSGSMTTEFVCPQNPPFVHCRPFTPPSTAKTVTLIDINGGANPLARFFV